MFVENVTEESDLLGKTGNEISSLLQAAIFCVQSLKGFAKCMKEKLRYFCMTRLVGHGIFVQNYLLE